MCWGDYQQNSRLSVNRQEHLRNSFSNGQEKRSLTCVSLDVQIQTGIF